MNANNLIGSTLVKRSLLFVLSLASSCVFGNEPSIQTLEFTEEYAMPWLTGPLISPSGYVVPKGHFNIQPYYYYTFENRQYDEVRHLQQFDKTVIQSIVVPMKVGLGGYFDLGFVPGAAKKDRDNQSSTGLIDALFSLSYQLTHPKIQDPWPALRLVFRTIIPLGKYQHLNPEKQKTDALGFGAWWPGVGLSGSKLWHLKKTYYLNTSFGVAYYVSTPVRVHGFNRYGGASNTNAKVYNGNFWTVVGAMEITLSQNWAFACDILYEYNNKNRFKGFAGTDSSGNLLSLSVPSGDNLSISPAFEYNFSSNLGLIAGVWFSVTGRNSIKFTTGVVALNVYI